MKLEDIEVGKSFMFAEIELFTDNSPDFQLNELGEDIVGKGFLVLENIYQDEVYSFVLTGASSAYIYTCVYADK